MTQLDPPTLLVASIQMRAVQTDGQQMKQTGPRGCPVSTQKAPGPGTMSLGPDITTLIAAGTRFSVFTLFS
jgi:hypothetical protein